MRRFQDRDEAGRLLAERLAPYAGKRPVVLALPRGGLPVAARIAEALRAPLDILAVKKIGAPGHDELAVGAVSEDGVPVFNEDLVATLDPHRSHVIRAAAAKSEEVRRQVAMYRRVREPESVSGRAVILVDDGLATGATMEAAVQVLRGRGAAEVIVAVPVASSEAYWRLKESVDELVALEVPSDFYAVGVWYNDFSQVEDEEALSILRDQGTPDPDGAVEESVEITTESGPIRGDLALPAQPKALILFAHGSGSSRLSPRNRAVAQALREEGFGTLLFDLLTDEEARDRGNVFDIDLLADRLTRAKAWAQERYPGLPVGYFGASTGAAAALQSAARDSRGLFAVVSRGGRPDLAMTSLPRVAAPVLLLVGGDDGPVAPLNRAAADRLPRGRLVVIPGATHLFEEPGKLEEVVDYALDWFQQHLPGRVLRFPEPRPDTQRELLRLARPLRHERDLHELAKQVASRRIVMLGESTHGTREFYELRRELTRILVRDHGFHFVAVEGDWPDCHSIHRFITGRNAKGIRTILSALNRWPTWMWGNEEVAKLAELLRDGRAGFFGLDVYSLYESVGVIHRYAQRFGSEIASEVMYRYSCFEPFGRDEIAYAKSLLRFPEGCRDEVNDNLRDLLSLRLESTRLTEAELFDARQNARVIRNAEAYYRAMLTGEAESWNVRDRHMLETLDLLLERFGAASKAIVWAHNTHIGDYRATDMLEDGYVNLGGLARESYGEDQVALVGFGTHGGEVRAARAWGAADEVMRLPDARGGSIEADCHEVAREKGHDRFFLFFDEESRRGAFARRQGLRAVGVSYSPAYELSGHNYVPTELAKRFDAFVFVDRTHAVDSYGKAAETGLFPETWPSGV